MILDEDMRFLLKIRRKGILIFLKKLREAAGLEDDEVIAEVVGDSLVLRALKPKVVNVDPNLVKEFLEEARFEEHKYERILKNGESGA
jgi:bifunctional DNA-binding transcriptional regulator/antitoxin component of YhaV-PrlF toxin-antitoxin module